MKTNTRHTKIKLNPILYNPYHTTALKLKRPNPPPHTQPDPYPNKIARLTKISNIPELNNIKYSSPIKDINSSIAKDGKEDGNRANQAITSLLTYLNL
jgi:hypothetical protein